jgi:hypothetical protein
MAESNAILSARKPWPALQTPNRRSSILFIRRAKTHPHRAWIHPPKGVRTISSFFFATPSRIRGIRRSFSAAVSIDSRAPAKSPVLTSFAAPVQR